MHEQGAASKTQTQKESVQDMEAGTGNPTGI